MVTKDCTARQLSSPTPLRFSPSGVLVGCSFAHRRPTPRCLRGRWPAGHGSPRRCPRGTRFPLRPAPRERHSAAFEMYRAWSQHFPQPSRRPAPYVVPLLKLLVAASATLPPARPRPQKYEPPQCGCPFSDLSESFARTGRLIEAGAGELALWWLFLYDASTPPPLKRMGKGKAPLP